MYKADPEIEKREIIKRYRNLLRVWRSNREKGDRKRVRKAFELALDAHKDMRRKTGEPYIYHPLEVATIVAGEIGLGTTSIMSALLHDVVEDTDYTIEDMRLMFGDQVARIIDGLTKIQGIFDLTNTTRQAENFRKMLHTLSDDVRVILIKLADRLHNMRTLEAMPKDKQLKIASETLYLFAPLSHRLGLYAIKSELEDLALKYTEPEIYNSIKQKLTDTRAARTRFFNKFVLPIKQEMSARGMNYQILVREKSINSIWGKMKNKGIPFEEIYDLFAVRIILDVPHEAEKEECWRVYSIITDYYKPKLDRLRDWIAIPKTNGYEALHTTVMSKEGKWVEIQIRTQRMDELAERGYAAHWKYKGEYIEENAVDRWLDRIREILKNQDSNTLDFLKDFELNLYTEEITVFTPKGEFKTLPKGSTVLDFAYSIHSQMGHTCIGAKVNHVLTTINHVLKPGDQVEVLTSDIQSPREDWLDFVVTARAKANIKLVLKENRKEIFEKGKAKLDILFKKYNLVADKNILNKFQEFLKVGSLYDIYNLLLKNEIGEQEVKNFSLTGENKGFLGFITRPFTRNKPVEVQNLAEAIGEKLKSQPQSLLLGDDLKEIRYAVAQCCRPIPGDDVVGIQEGNSIIIHRTNCKEAIRLMSQYGDRIIKAKWKYKESIGFLTGITFRGIDRKGFIRKISEIISDKHNINIRSLHVDTSEGQTEGVIMLYVNDLVSLNKLLDALRNVKEIISVDRLDRMDQV